MFWGDHTEIKREDKFLKKRRENYKLSKAYLGKKHTSSRHYRF